MPIASGQALSVNALFAERDAQRRRDSEAAEQFQRRKNEELACKHSKRRHAENGKRSQPEAPADGRADTKQASNALHLLSAGGLRCVPRSEEDR